MHRISILKDLGIYSYELEWIWKSVNLYVNFQLDDKQLPETDTKVKIIYSNK